MKLKLNYFVIPGVTIIISALGRLFTDSKMEWYKTLIKPSLTPPNFVFPIAWTTIYILTTISALIIWNKTKSKLSMFIFALNVIFNIAWSFIFFNQHLIGIALIDAILLALTIYALILLNWNKARLAAILLLPYAIWVTFAIYLNYSILILN